MKHKKLYIGIGPIILATVFLIGSRKELFNDFFSAVKLKYLNSYLQNNYLYKIDEEKGIEGVYRGYLQSTENQLTYYLDADEFKGAQVEEEGHYFGTGIKMMWHLDGQSFIITDIIKESPADKAGIQVGDEIVQINGIQALKANVQQLTQIAFSNQIKPIEYVLKRADKEGKVSLTPERVTLQDIEDQVLENVMYIKCHTIQTGTSTKIRELIKKAEVNGLEGIILDVRDLYTNNIEEIKAICDLFLEKGTAFKVKSKKEIIAYTVDEEATQLPLCLVTNTGTAAGAEALVLALKERSIQVGSNTAGLSYTRQLVSLEDGSGMSVTSGVIYDQYGEVLDEEGVIPDQRVYISEEEKITLLEKGKVGIEQDSFIKAALLNFKGSEVSAIYRG